MQTLKCQHYSRPISCKIFNKGFTLVEVLLVALALSIIIGLTVARYSQTYKRFQLKDEAENLAYVMRYAQSRSEIKSRQLRLEFDPDFRKYWIVQKVSDENSTEFERISGRLGKIFKVPEQFRIEVDISIVNFYPDGRIDGQYIFVCDEQRCFTVSTKEQRGYVWIFDSKIE